MCYNSCRFWELWSETCCAPKGFECPVDADEDMDEALDKYYDEIEEQALQNEEMTADD